VAGGLAPEFVFGFAIVVLCISVVVEHEHPVAHQLLLETLLQIPLQPLHRVLCLQTLD